MNQTLRAHLLSTYFAEYQQLRDDLVDLLGDADLSRDVGGTSVSLGVLCREIGEVEHSYAESFRTYRQNFAYRHPDPRVEREVAVLSAWYADLDRQLMAALEDLSDEDVTTRRIVRSDFEIDGFSPLATVQLDIYREALLIFYAKASIYLRSMSKDLPPRWQAWIG